MIILYLFFSICLIVNPISGTEISKIDTTRESPQQSYKIDQPGTITFTVGVKIKGKIEKPQVMIFLPKEKTLYKEHVLDYSFSKELSEPLPYIPIIE